MELSIRGQRADDAISMVEQYLEQAYMARLPFLRIVHGKGTGTLRQVVQDLLNRRRMLKNGNLRAKRKVEPA